MVQIFTKENFKDDVINSKIPVLVDFYAEWCGPCKMMAPIIEEFSVDYEGKYKVGKVNIDQDEQLASEYGVMSIPTIKVFKNGKVVSTSVGATTKAHLLEMMQ